MSSMECRAAFHTINSAATTWLPGEPALPETARARHAAQTASGGAQMRVAQEPSAFGEFFGSCGDAALNQIEKGGRAWWLHSPPRSQCLTSC
jgi:hypothetical protein